MKAAEVEDRLISFAVLIVDLVEHLPNSKAGNHIANQLIRSGTSPAPNYAEARGSESQKDFIHKIKIALKELRETMVWLQVIYRKNMIDKNLIPGAIAECNKLIAMFVSSTKTAEANLRFPSQKKS